MVINDSLSLLHIIMIETVVDAIASYAAITIISRAQLGLPASYQ